MNASTQPSSATTALPLCCPSCHGDLTASEASSTQPTGLLCRSCTLEFPLLGEVTCLYPKGAADLALWQARAHKEQQDLLHKLQAVNQALVNLELKADSIPTATKERLQQLEEGYAGQLDCLGELLAPVLSDGAGSDRATYAALNTQALSNNTTLFSYATNLFRDWVWGEAENNQAIDMLAQVAPGSLGRTLVLGAGGGRLAWDLASGSATAVCAVDINPLTSLAAAAICNDRPVRLWEFPLAPVKPSDVALHRELLAPTSIPISAPNESAIGRTPITWLLADARALPFPPGSFDTVVTPWFTDVVQSSPAATAAQVNGLLAPEGRWLNFGSVAFADADPAQCLLLPELCDLVAAQGFTEPTVIEQRGPYLCSPHSRYGRYELLHAFSATKNASAPHASRKTTAQNTQPIWLQNSAIPVPALTQFQDQAMATQVHAYLLSLIDGERSINEIADILQQRQLISAHEARPLIQGFLEKMLLE